MSYNSPFSGDVIQPTDVSYRSITLSTNEQLAWPINGGDTNNAAARIMDVQATASSLTINMPPASQSSVGIDALFRNTGSYTFTVNDFAGTPIVTIEAGQSRYIYLTSNATDAGTWESIAFGVGASNVDAAALAGFGLKAITNTLNSSHNVSTFSSNYTTLASDRAASYVWTGGSGTLTLTDAAVLGNDWFMLLRNNGTGTLAINPVGGILINSLSSISLQPGDSCVICCSGTAFFTVGLGRSTQFNFSQLTKSVESGTYTLSSSEASNVIQKYTGVLSADVTVIVPQTVQVYYISNQTNGGGPGYTITFTTNTGGSVAVVPPGTQVILLCDSVSLLNASTIAVGALTFSLIDGTAGAPSLNFGSETSTGIYRPGSGEFGISILSNQMFSLTATGLNVPGGGNFIGGVTGGTF
jgi:hypothetical protein